LKRTITYHIGLFGVPKDLYAQQYQRAVTEFSHKFHRDTTIKEIHFVDIDKGMCYNKKRCKVKQ
jgi:O-acetyl-ADP-ribose deacetylase (regulator of RNase III)